MFYDNFMNLLFIFSIALFEINCYNIINILIILYSFYIHFVLCKGMITLNK